jgi:ADP-heptose:LPS heptosyltransferase
MKQYRIVVQIGSPPQFFAVKPLLEALIENNIEFMCFTPKVNQEQRKQMFDLTYELVRKSRFPVTRNIDSVYTKIYLAAWPTANIEYKYLLRYTYSLLSAKPNPVYLPDSLRRYHGILTQNRAEYEMLKVYSATYFVSNLKYIGWKKQKTNGKTILYLPTWNTASMGEIGKINSNEEILPALEKLKGAGYYIIVKAHPLTLSDPEAKTSTHFLKNYADEYYESDTPIQELLAKSDIVISDNSGAIHEALYSNIPVIVYGHNTEKRRFGEILPMHHKLIQQKLIENPKTTEDILDAVKKGLSETYLKQQIKVSDSLFCKDYSESAISGWLDVIMKYLEDNIDQDYIILHNYYNDYIDLKNSEISELHMKQAEYKSMIRLEQNPGIRTASKRLLQSVQRRLGAVK